MAASDFILTVRVHEIALREAGDRAREGENVINLALLWPRPGQDEVMGTTGLVTLHDHGEGDAPDRPPAFRAPVLKERVRGDVALMVHVLERDATNKAARFFRRIASAAVQGASRGWGSGIVRHAFSEAVERGGVMIGEREDERLDAVAVSEAPHVLTQQDLAEIAASGEPLVVHLQLATPRRVLRSGEKDGLAARRDNGHVALDLRVEAG